MKTNSVVSPRKAQRIVLNLEADAMGVSKVEGGMTRLLEVRRDEERHEVDGGDNFMSL